MSLSSWKPPKFGCAGLCPGDRCGDCMGLADQIRQAKRGVPGPRRDALLLILADRVADLMAVRRG